MKLLWAIILIFVNLIDPIGLKIAKEKKTLT